ncbi:DNA-3-methyladenine glycosylase [Phytoactinopolyspora sp. XMNu-373]|uniref:Putative 3-methyladenine DNA glycosylase n=2 Tax=Phytoactinopolyspora mesophila TaxID=2650750 RepID=A0A7K3M4M6_9ACTN|nr:DNA-3-methyladenine glycosylase [Phytoactinopolyspora mesophila]NDL57378.1 DNA-3-methyladenine glycosylase [Phytoactinopolyspora mesophila]
MPASQSEKRRWLARPATEVAPALLGCVVRHEDDDGAVAIRLTEVEAYMGSDDPGSHAFRGQTPRNAVMFGDAGHLYVYFTYGMHFCANIVCGPVGLATAVLLRGGEVVEGEELARKRRPAARSARDLARGPARLASALGLGRELNGVDLLTGTGGVSLDAANEYPEPRSVATGPRVGVAGKGGDGGRFPWRYWLEGDPTVSRYRPGNVRRGRSL